MCWIGKLEELRNALDKTRQELDATKARLGSTQQSLAEKEAHLANLRIERRKQLEEILEMKDQRFRSSLVAPGRLVASASVSF
uniref:Uncharacterized protein n=1 Tax=Sphaerodactylus townsendi TaxID=933632 RepID=A0ACB8EHT8_9SAUR